MKKIKTEVSTATALCILNIFYLFTDANLTWRIDKRVNYAFDYKSHSKVDMEQSGAKTRTF